MEKHEKREGDTRAFVHDPLVHLHWWPRRGFPFRWKAKHGEPECVGEKISQAIWSHRVALYIAVVVTVILVVQLFGISVVGR